MIILGAFVMSKVSVFTSTCSMALVLGSGFAMASNMVQVSDDVVSKQRAALAEKAKKGTYGPQAPRDIDVIDGANTRIFAVAPSSAQMNLCNIHFHKNAEHRGGQFTSYAGNGDGEGNGTGYRFDGKLSKAELAPYKMPVGVSKHGDLVPGDTIEIHFVHSSAQIKPGPTLGSCISEEIANPQLRVETVVAVLVNDENASDFVKMAQIEQLAGYYQVPNLPNNLGESVSYAGSTTGPSYNEKPSPFQVTWNVRPQVLKLDIASVATWLDDNSFDEKYAHGVRNLVTNPDLLSKIK
tara:strand:+ start:3599 stop:4483 length:885 start_codon:yes stop_codon:yes gene_type:complete